MTHKHFLRLTLISFILAATCNFGSAFAMGQVTLTVKNPDPYTGNHSWFLYEKEAGQIIEDSALLKNFGNEPSQVSVYAVDALSSESGSFILSFPKTKQNNIGSWTTIKKRTLTINPHDTVEIPFEIRIPSGVTPGQYIGGIVVESEAVHTPPISIADENGGTNVSVKTRIGTRIYLTVPGDVIEDIRTTDIKVKSDLNGLIKFHFTVENKGNTSHTPQAHIELYDTMGNLYETIDQSLGTSAPLSTIKPIIKMKQKPLLGNFHAKVAITYVSPQVNGALHGASHSDYKDINFSVVPWKIIILILLLITAITGAIIFQKRKKQMFYIQSETIKINECDNLMTIAKERNINWKKLAKYNKIKPPYVVNEGDKIIVPKKTKSKNKWALNKNKTNT